MPLAVRDYTWEETEKMVFLTVPLKGVKANKVNILSSEDYIKVSYPPYFFECFLCESVDDVSSTAQIGNGAVVFKLQKKEPQLWNHLHHDKSDDKEFTKRMREEAVTRNQERAEVSAKEKAEKKKENEKYAMNEMMKLEQEERDRISNIKESEKKKAMEELEIWKEEQRQAAEREKNRILEEGRAKEAARKEEMRKEKKKKSKNIFEDASNGMPTRDVGRIEIKFTPRVFPTPVRESQSHLEDEWLKKQAEARRITEIEDEDLTEEEKDPIYLRDKGVSFFKSGNYQAAVNAFTTALRFNPKMPSLYSNRAACHLKTRNFFKCIEDCSKAMDLLSPPVPQNASSRCKALVRRGTAFCELEMYVEGLQDYEAALKIDPNDKQVREDAEKMRKIIQSSSES
ncbi:dynein axonemal assembly factor 4-like [Ostrea edulis]|uniref:dynein axonemal assembly factor 4-like n=1 Tax=Ostrea edulis TaxID=37623 RepID=UPI0020950598|nr:dynein axonemal assembly factor 4-like [Ostrea edulis]